MDFLSAYQRLLKSHPAYFSPARIEISASQAEEMIAVIGVLDAAFQNAACQQYFLGEKLGKTEAVLMGYDFHLTDEGAKLIEINTNAGGAMLNACLLAGRGKENLAKNLADNLLSMFLAVWQKARGNAPLRFIAIVDDAPEAQFLSAEFDLFRALFLSAGISAVVVDPADITANGALFYQGKPIDLVYNRLTDFALAEEKNQGIYEAFIADTVVISPNPQHHQLYANKKNLIALGDPEKLSAFQLSEEQQVILQKALLKTFQVSPDARDFLWETRKQWFFKPPSGFGGKAAYRGDKLTRRVFAEILAGDYLAQEIALPSTHEVRLQHADGSIQTEIMKADFRGYCYLGKVQHIAARLYQGQTTNFRTTGGGFALVDTI